MDTQQQREERLWSYIDGQGSAEERSVIGQLLQSNAEWKAQYHELLAINDALQQSELEAPSMRFTRNVMEEIGKLHIAPATHSYLNKRLIWGIGGFFILMLITMIIYGIGQVQVDWAADGTTKKPDLSFLDKLDKVNISNFFSNTWINVFMMVNVVLGLFLFDAYLSNKRKQFRRQS
jgi:hypothetical protein